MSPSVSESAAVPAPASSDTALLDRLHAITTELVEHHRSLALLLAAEKEGRVAAWHNATADSVSGRDRVADFNIVPVTVDILVLKGDIAALIEERDYIRLLLILPVKDA